MKKPADVFEFAELLNGHLFVNEKDVLLVSRLVAQFKAVVGYAPSQRVPKPCSRKDSREGTIFKAIAVFGFDVDNKDPDYLEFLKESVKLRQQIQMSLNSNRHLMGDSLSSLTVKELKQLENRLERGITRFRFKKHEMPLAEIEFLQKREIELENESVCLRSKVCKSVRSEMERFQQANTVTGQELSAIHALASRNFFSPAIIEGGGTAYSHPDKKILYLR
ncbi:Agamous-like MADS-box protein AGL11 [Citrus sinensis]|nr:Agamous-like MADS-box protein AGL11 [Citrus sinensis]KAH9725193.1 Agamous-like MADS-box protein AGL11 [Citrus sinensis]KAH9725205.1 Agamous-like MADS-box protein AGL11 [Citrus sinensis]